MSDKPRKSALGIRSLSSLGKPPLDLAAAIRELAFAQSDCALAVMAMRISSIETERGNLEAAQMQAAEAFKRAQDAFDRAMQVLEHLPHE